MITIILLWYFAFKASDYTITFTSKTFPETINQSIKLWSIGLPNVLDLKEIDGDKHLAQTLKFNDSIHTYDWRIKIITDSTSKVIVGVKDKNFMNSILNRLQVPFSKTNFSLGAEKRIYEFMSILKDHVDNFKITIIGIEEMPTKNLAYIPLKKIQYEKAKGMMENSSFVGQVLNQNTIEIDGPPMIEVTNWNRQNDTISYNFGYPIKPKELLPSINELQYKKLEAKKGIKAIYNGNYITSDRAWYALLHYAQKNGIEVVEQPLEIFFNNPDMGGDALRWKTEVYLPITSNKE